MMDEEKLEKTEDIQLEDVMPSAEGPENKENESGSPEVKASEAESAGPKIDRKRLLYVGAAAAGIIVLMICFYGINAAATAFGRGVGNVSGTVVGAAVGSAGGIKDGVTEGIQAGIEEGLSAEDTKVELGQAMQSVGKLEVLVAGVTLESINRIGNAYAGLYVIAGDAVFTVDLSETEVVTSDDGREINITIPEPELSLFLDQNSTEKLAEVQNFSWSVSAEDGLKEYLNSMAKTKEEAEEYLSNYSDLYDSAMDAAITQVKQLASRLNIGNASVRVAFREE